MSPIGYPGGVCTGKIRINSLMPGNIRVGQDTAETVRPSKVRKANR